MDDYELDDFYGCCGATVIHFYENSEANIPSCQDEHLYLAILLNCQLKGIGAKLRKAGFRCVSSKVKNRSTGNRLYLFIRDKMPIRKRIKKHTFRRFR